MRMAKAVAPFLTHRPVVTISTGEQSDTSRMIVHASVRAAMAQGLGIRIDAGRPIVDAELRSRIAEARRRARAPLAAVTLSPHFERTPQPLTIGMPSSQAPTATGRHRNARWESVPRLSGSRRTGFQPASMSPGWGK